MIDFKIVEEREVNGLIYQKVRFYEGAVTTDNELVFNGEPGEMQPVTRYRRTSLIEEREYFYEPEPGS